MTYSEVKKTCLGVFLVLVLYPIVAYAALYTDGLSRVGSNVCEEQKRRSVASSIRVTTVNYVYYKTRCGVFGWNRCTKSRTVTGYRRRTVYQWTTDTYLLCCRGWQRRGDSCPIAICDNGCSHGGNCARPNSCRCTPFWTGPTCSIDVNECSPNKGGCEQGCSNKRGAARLCYCYPGYNVSKFDDTKCNDVDECTFSSACTCASGSNSCGKRCMNTVGSFKCTCDKGYRLQSDTVCTDIDECAVNNGGCRRQCVNYPGWYKCNCPRGFRLVSGKACRDINECVSNNGNCHHTCRNLFGSHRCSCDKGFNLNSNGRTCSDIDECKLGHDCQGICSNTLGGYKCSCNKGYQLTTDNRTCTDVDECDQKTIAGSKETATLSGCHHICTNVEGSFQCSCRKGYALMYDKRQCKDVDECHTGSHSCEHYCHNTDGHYFCSCRPGYTLSSDGKKCKAQPCEKIFSPPHGGMNCSGLVTDATCSFSCEPGYDLVGSQSRTCLASSRWSGKLPFCQAKHCKTLTARGNKTISMPCFTSLGSTCHFGCLRGFFLVGDGQANCSLNSKGDDVSWNFGRFSCKRIKTCQPNPCRKGGKCLTLNEKDYTCDCEGTGYKGSHCETGHVVTPIFPKLLTKKKSRRLFLLARPSGRLRVVLTSEKEVTFQPQSAVFDPSNTMDGFTVLAEKPGIRRITYDLEGESKNDFEAPTPGVLFSAPKMSLNDSLSTKVFLRKGELPIGCEEHQTKLSCEVRLLSTTPWTRNPLSTSGIVHITASNNQNIPLSLIGLNPRDGVSRDKMIEAGISMTSSSKKYALLLSRNGTCQARVTDSNSLLELIQNDAFLSSFMEALSLMTPEWLSFSVDENNNAFDIQNIAASLTSGLEHCVGFPLNRASSLVYYRPVGSFKIRVAQTDVSLFADGTTCFAINICNPGLFVSLSEGPAYLLKSSLNIFRDMQDNGLSLQVDSIGLHRDKETIRFVNGIIWNGKKLQKLSPLPFNMWLKGNLNWKFGVPKLLLLSFRMRGEAIIRTEYMDSLFTILMSQRMDMQLRGEASLNVSGRALRKDFILKLGSIKASGKALLGGKGECRKNVRGIFLELEKSASNFLNESPFATHIRPIENQPVRLAMLMSVSGGMQNTIVNMGEVKSFLSSIISLIPDLEDVVMKAKEVMPHGKIALQKSLDIVSETNVSVNELEKMITGDTMEVTRGLTLLNRIENNLKYLISITDVIIDHIPSSSNKGKYAELSTRIDGIQARFPQQLRPNLDGEPIEQTFNGISFYFRGNICMKHLCLKDLGTTVDYLTERNCVSNTPHTSVFRGRGEALVQMALSKDNILTLPMGNFVDFIFPRDSETVSAHFVGRSSVLAVIQHVEVSLNENQLSFEMQGKIFDRYMANMDVVAKIGHATDWSSLIFAVNGRMSNSSQLSNLLQSQVTTFASFLAERAAKRIERCERSILSAEERLKNAKELVKKKKAIFDEALLEKQRRLSRFQRLSAAYGKASIELESSLDQFLKVKNRKRCQFLSCDFIDANTYIPAVCQKPVFVNYTVPVCRKVKETLKEEVIVSKVVKEIEMVQTSIVTEGGNCGKSGNIFALVKKFLFGCDSYQMKEPGPKIPFVHHVTKNFREYKTKEIERFICDAVKTETVVSGYLMYECPKNGSIKVLDPACVSHNTNCSFELDNLAAEIEFENDTMFVDFQDMLTKGKQSTLAQLDLNKAEIKFDSAVWQLELARARLQQREFTRKAINLNTVKQREKLGLKLDKNMKKRKGKPLIYVESLAFLVALSSSSTKTRFPLTAYVRTFEGSQKEIQFPMDFRNEQGSLALASKRIIETLFGTSNGRRRRSVREEPIVSKTNDTNFSFEGHECHLSKEANIIFSDIVESMDFSIKSKREIDQAVFAGNRRIEELDYYNNNDENTSYSDMRQFLKDAQLNTSGATSWSDILNDARGFLDFLTQKKNFTQCSGILDCVDFFFDSLEEMYEMENHPRAIEIKKGLQSLNKIISSILRENITMSLLEQKLSQAKLLISESNDEMILCGQKPTIQKSSPVKVVSLLGGDIYLFCEAKSTLGVEYVWMKNGLTLEGENSTILQLKNVTQHSEGAYKCHASNSRGSTVSNVTILAVHQKPHIIEHPLDEKKLVGDEIMWMVCNSTGVPTPSTVWFFIPMKGMNQNAIRLNMTGPVLEIGNLTTDNAGFYYCSVSNLHGAVQSRIARLDVLRFIPGVPSISLSLKLKQCFSTPSVVKSSPHNCNDNTKRKFQQIDMMAYQNITQKMLEQMSWPMKKIHNEYYTPFPDAVISFVLHGEDPITPEGKKLEALNKFSLSRRLIGNSLKKLYSSLKDEKVKTRWGNVTIIGDKDSLVVGFPSQKCPSGTRIHEDGYLCVYCPPGYYEVGNGTCEPCPVGTYQPDEGSTECVRCPYRVSSTEPGAVRESHCSDISIPCIKPPQTEVAGAQMPSNAEILHYSGETLDFECQPGYKVVGNATVECHEGNWTEVDFSCEKTCYPPWTELKKRCYLVTEAQVQRWKDVPGQCLKLNSLMVTISSEEENEFVHQLAQDFVREKKWSQAQMWLGLWKMHAIANFLWVDGSILKGYTNWAPGEPNNAGGLELCTEMLVSGKYQLGKWNDVNCHAARFKSITVCEKPLIEREEE